MKALARLTLLATLLFALTAVTFAANKNQGNFTLPETARVGSTDLSAGDYKAEWKADSDGAVKVDILQHGKTVATVQGKLKDLPSSASHDTVILRSLGNNANAIDEIDFGNRKQAIVFGE